MCYLYLIILSVTNMYVQCCVLKLYLKSHLFTKILYQIFEHINNSIHITNIIVNLYLLNKSNLIIIIFINNLQKVVCCVLSYKYDAHIVSTHLTQIDKIAPVRINVRSLHIRVTS